MRTESLSLVDALRVAVEQTADPQLLAKLEFFERFRAGVPSLASDVAPISEELMATLTDFLDTSKSTVHGYAPGSLSRKPVPRSALKLLDAVDWDESAAEINGCWFRGIVIKPGRRKPSKAEVLRMLDAKLEELAGKDDLKYREEKWQRYKRDGDEEIPGLTSAVFRPRWKRAVDASKQAKKR